MPRVDRSYSQYKEIREYQDRGMMKWQGFFLSEHQAAMKAEREEKILHKYKVISRLV